MSKAKATQLMKDMGGAVKQNAHARVLVVCDHYSYIADRIPTTEEPAEGEEKGWVRTLISLPFLMVRGIFTGTAVTISTAAATVHTVAEVADLGADILQSAEVGVKRGQYATDGWANEKLAARAAKASTEAGAGCTDTSFDEPPKAPPSGPAAFVADFR